MGDKINNNGFLQIDAEKDILSSFLNAEALNYHSSHHDEDIHLQYNSKSPKRGFGKISFTNLGLFKNKDYVVDITLFIQRIVKFVYMYFF